MATRGGTVFIRDAAPGRLFTLHWKGPTLLHILTSLIGLSGLKKKSTLNWEGDVGDNCEDSEF